MHTLWHPHTLTFRYVIAGGPQQATAALRYAINSAQCAEFSITVCANTFPSRLMPQLQVLRIIEHRAESRHPCNASNLASL
jgi:hypothetical protein